MVARSSDYTKIDLSASKIKVLRQQGKVKNATIWLCRCLICKHDFTLNSANLSRNYVYGGHQGCPTCAENESDDRKTESDKILIAVPHSFLLRIDRTARAYSMNRSEFVRRAIEKELERIESQASVTMLIAYLAGAKHES